MNENDVRDVLTRINPGLTTSELDNLAEALVDEYGDYDHQNIKVDRDTLQEVLDAVKKLRHIYRNIEPQTGEDVVTVNDLGTLEYKISELLV